MSVYKHTIRNKVYKFLDLKTLLGKSRTVKHFF